MDADEALTSGDADRGETRAEDEGGGGADGELRAGRGGDAADTKHRSDIGGAELAKLVDPPTHHLRVVAQRARILQVRHDLDRFVGAGRVCADGCSEAREEYGVEEVGDGGGGGVVPRLSSRRGTGARHTPLLVCDARVGVFRRDGDDGQGGTRRTRRDNGVGQVVTHAVGGAADGDNASVAQLARGAGPPAFHAIVDERDARALCSRHGVFLLTGARLGDASSGGIGGVGEGWARQATGDIGVGSRQTHRAGDAGGDVARWARGAIGGTGGGIRTRWTGKT